MKQYGMTRRQLLTTMLAGTLPLGAQMASRGVKAMPRGKPTGIPFRASLTDVAAQAGLRQPIVYGGVASNAYILEADGCGIAFIDYDNDGWLDALVIGGTRWEGAPAGATNRLYKNNRDGTFTDVTQAAGLTLCAWCCGITIGDYNNDGFEDIFISGWPRNYLYRNNGNGTFTDVTQEAGLLDHDGRWSSGCTFVETSRNGRLDLFVSHYLKFDPALVPRAGKDAACNYKGILINCGPRGLKPETHSLYRNDGDGTFTDISRQSGIAKVTGSYGLTAVAADFDDDGWPEIYVACDSTPSLLFKRQGDGTFVDVGMESGVALNEDGNEQAGMGLGIGDFNLDGRLDILKTHFTEDTPALYVNRGGRLGFEDATIRAGLGVETRYVSWGAAIVDLDNDGWPDLFWVTGSVYPEVEKALPQLPYKTPRIVFRNLGNGSFEELLDGAGPGVTEPHSSRGCAVGDFDNDGDMDILIANLNEPPSLLRNDVSGNANWLKVKLLGVKSNRSAIGARVTALYGGRRQAQEVLAQSSYLSVSDRRLHFGLGTFQHADLEVRWPSGIRQEFKNVDTNGLVTIDEIRGIVSFEKWRRAQRPT
jgi:hypothetical protein